MLVIAGSAVRSKIEACRSRRSSRYRPAVMPRNSAQLARKRSPPTPISRHRSGAPRRRLGAGRCFGGGEAADQRLDQALLDRPRHFRVGQHPRLGLGQPAGLSMQAPQTRRVARGGPQNSAGGGQVDRRATEGPAMVFELLRFERDHAPDAMPGRPLMQPLAKAVEHDVTRRDRRAAPHRRQAGEDRKRDENQLRRQREIGDSRMILLATQQLHVMQLGRGRRAAKGPEKVTTASIWRSRRLAS
jgi:hypothetical protein